MKITSACIMLLCSIATSAQAANPPCLSDNEMEDVFLALAPAMLKSMRNVCAATLPSSARLMQLSTPFSIAVETVSKEAFTRALPSVVRVMAATGETVSESEAAMTQQEFSDGMEPIVKDIIEEKDCGPADRLLSLIEPLPIQNIGGLFVELVHLQIADPKNYPKAQIVPLCSRQKMGV